MTEIIMQAGVGLLVIIIGILNMKGNISLLHSYHTKRVKEEDVLPFGRKVGLGAIIMGCTMIAAAIAELFFENITNIILIAGFIPGIGLIVYAMFKYNKGIF